MFEGWWFRLMRQFHAHLAIERDQHTEFVGGQFVSGQDQHIDVGGIGWIAVAIEGLNVRL
ncbi:MAG: hypothetical protein B7Z68_00675 [Acidobacteria bacterium 21-70-11]|nr:MAG: hypothetical protein B7Z68_00675 [Acidobacteria bacterium 21-70-11]